MGGNARFAEGGLAGHAGRRAVSGQSGARLRRVRRRAADENVSFQGRYRRTRGARNPRVGNGTGRRAEPHPDRGGRRERRGADGALFRQGRTDAGRAALGSEAGTRQARPDPGVLRFGQARHRGQAADGIHHQRSARSDQGARFQDDGRARDRGRQLGSDLAVRLQERRRTAFGRNDVLSRRVGEGDRRHGAGQLEDGQQGKNIATVRRGGQEPCQSDRNGSGRHRLHGQTERDQDEPDALLAGRRHPDRADPIPRTSLPGRRAPAQDRRGREARRAAEPGALRGPDDSGRILQGAQADDRAGTGRASSEYPEVAAREPE